MPDYRDEYRREWDAAMREQQPRDRSILPAPCQGIHTPGTTYSCPYCGALTNQLATWRYQRKEGWGDIWRTTTEDPFREGFFETTDDWRIERVDTPVTNGVR